MHGVIDHVLNEIRGAWRFRRVAIVVVWVFCLVGWLVVFALPDQYEADAQFYVDTTTRLDEVMGGVIIAADERSQITLVRQAMLSTPVLERVARDSDLDLRARTAAEKRSLIEGLARRIEISSPSARRVGGRIQDDGIFKITYRDRERSKSLAVVDTLLDTFREDVVSGRAHGSKETVEFLEVEITNYGEQLRLTEQAIAKFKQENVGLLPGEGGGYFENLQKTLGDARLLEAERSVLVDRRNTLMQQMSGENPILAIDGAGGSGIGVPQNDLESRIEELEASVEEMLTRYTEKWPDVIAARDQLEQMYKRRAEELAELAAAGDSGTSIPSNNPVYQQLQIALNDTDIQIAEIEARLTALRAQISDLQERVDVIPNIEANLAALTRDYDQIRNVYSELRERLEQEQLRSKRLGWDGVTFRIIDPPKVGFEPVAPMRVQLILLVVVFGLGAGGAMAWLLQQIKPVFIDQSTLREVTGLPVLGCVSMTWQSRHKSQRRRELTALISAMVLIFVLMTFAILFMDEGVQFGVELKRMASL